MNVGDAIQRARYTLNDNSANTALLRYSAAEMTAYVYDGVLETATLRPDLFTVEIDFVCDAGPLQDIGSKGLYVLDVIGVKDATSPLSNGVANYKAGVLKADLETLRRFRPSWGADPQAQCENWMAFPNDQTKRPSTRFYVYPPAPASQLLGVQIVRNPWWGITVTTATDLPIPVDMHPLIPDYIIFRAESKNDESALSGRAIASYNKFLDGIGRSELKRKQVVQEGRPQ